MGGSGRLYRGCNVENASYGLTLCAERAAVTAMVAAGERAILAVAIATVGAVTPCGACRQVVMEFGNDFPVLLIDAEKRQLAATWNINELLPGAFGLYSGHGESR